jgi:group II intron reverse transcriptase/maturase
LDPKPERPDDQKRDPRSRDREIRPVYPGLRRIAELAREAPDRKLTSLNQYLTPQLLREAYEKLNKKAAAGVDGKTWHEYGRGLDKKLVDLKDRAKSGRYRAPPVRRVEIPKGTGSQTRPLGIPTIEDKVLQRAVAWILEAVLEQDFLDCSYGFRPGRSPHQALHALREQMMALRNCWVIEVDIQKFFDEVHHKHLIEFLRQRVRDGVILRLISKWLHAGILKDGELWFPERGTPQGGVISPLLANLYLHHVFDKWFETDIRPRLRGRASLVRYADDFVIVTETEADADRLYSVLPKRAERYGLRLHPKKTQKIDFRPDTPMALASRRDRPRGSRTFDFLGFTHYWARSRTGAWVVKRKTARDRLTRANQTISRWCQQHRHQKVRWQAARLAQKLRGHVAYYGIRGNYSRLYAFYRATERTWHKWLNRRSQRKSFNWDQFKRTVLIHYPLPAPRIMHNT